VFRSRVGRHTNNMTENILSLCIAVSKCVRARGLFLFYYDNPG